MRHMFTALAAAGVMAAGFIGSAQAGEFAFRYRTGELQTPSGLTQLYERIRLKAEEVCEPDQRGLWRHKAVPRCVDATTRHVVAKIGHPALIAMHEAEHIRYAQR